MQRSAESFLWDACNAADAIARFADGKTLDDYVADLMLRSAIERQFEIVGEALGQFAKVAPELAAQIADLAQSVGFHNRLIHGYATIASRVVWQAVHEDLRVCAAR
jgi:uncharacterized protein with HEPN domain